MSELSESARKIRQRIEETFGHRKRLSVVLRKGTAIWDDQERLQFLTVGSMFESGRRRWQDIDCEEIDPYLEEIIIEYLTPEALRYYLPAFMTCCLDFPENDVLSLGMIHLLIPPIDGKEVDSGVYGQWAWYPNQKDSSLALFEKWARQFTPAECATITAFLECVLLEQIISYQKRYEPTSDFVEFDRAYEYWSQRC